MSSLFSPAWAVSQSGYTWIDATEVSEKAPRRWLTDRIPLAVRQLQVKRYRPLDDHPALFRVFSEVTPDELGIATFASKYGLLVQWHQIYLPEGMPGAGESALGEPLDLWEPEIRQMRLAVSLWDALQDKDLEALRSLLSVEEKYDQHWVYVVDPVDGTRSFCCAMDRSMALGEIALFAVADKINRGLDRAVSARMVQSQETNRLTLRVGPTSLLSTLWFQFARAVDGNRQYRTCPECGTWFEISADGARSNRQYCTDACRMRAYRTRKAARADQ